MCKSLVERFPQETEIHSNTSQPLLLTDKSPKTKSLSACGNYKQPTNGHQDCHSGLTGQQESKSLQIIHTFTTNTLLTHPDENR